MKLLIESECSRVLKVGEKVSRLDLSELLNIISYYQKTYGRIPFDVIQQEKNNSISWLEDIKSVLEILSDNAFSQVKVWVIKDEQVVNDFGYTFHAATSTIKLVEYAYLLEDVADVYLLLRKIFESLLQYLFFHVIRKNVRSINIDLNDENMNKLFESYLFDDAYDTEKSKMDYWATGTPLDTVKQKQRRKSITIQNYIHFLNKEFPRLEECTTKYFPETFNSLLRKMDDFSHGNTLATYAHPKQDRNYQVIIQRDAIDLITIILVYVSIIEATLLMSSDYIDALEAGLAPEECSQYWIAPAFSIFFDKYVDPKYPGLRKYLSEYNSAEMNILN